MNFNLTPVVKYLLIINIGIFIISYFLFVNTGIDINNILGLHSLFSDQFSPYQFISYMFLHAYVSGYGQIYFMHIFSNMFALFMFGPMLERVWGPKRFLTFYLICGLGSGVLYWGINAWETYSLKEDTIAYVNNPTPDNFVRFLKEQAEDIYQGQMIDYVNQFSNDPNNEGYIKETKEFVVEKVYEPKTRFSMVGASGAIFGILMGYGMLFPNTVLMLLFPPIPIKAKYFVAFYGLFEIYAGIKQTPGDNVAHFAHIGGMIFAFILIKFWNNKSNRFY